jgi:hypothetical protein
VEVNSPILDMSAALEKDRMSAALRWCCPESQPRATKGPLAVRRPGIVVSGIVAGGSACCGRRRGFDADQFGWAAGGEGAHREGPRACGCAARRLLAGDRGTGPGLRWIRASKRRSKDGLKFRLAMEGKSRWD